MSLLSDCYCKGGLIQQIGLIADGIRTPELRVHRASGRQVALAALLEFSCLTWRLLCSSLFGGISQSLTRKQVITDQELHRSLQEAARKEGIMKSKKLRVMANPFLP